MICKRKCKHCFCKECEATHFNLELKALEAKPPLDKCYSLALYEGAFQQCFQLLKFEGRKDIAIFFQKKIIQSEYLDSLSKEFLVVSVPSFWLNKLSRGYNPAELIFKPWLLQKQVLVRKNWGLPSYMLGKKRRQKQLKKAFCVQDKQVIQNKMILLCDDLVTTQSTLCEIASLLLDAGAKKVVGLGFLFKK